MKRRRGDVLQNCEVVHVFLWKTVQITAIQVKKTFHRNTDIISHVVFAASASAAAPKNTRLKLQHIKKKKRRRKHRSESSFAQL
ncbi:Hypothetical predicted protein [Scomber scombrus]|uniref:Secreted protein n=1 Tax=Scomber scombrus TaxID=13677 RepID=A0AAV1Q1E8_SCOSC